MDTSRLSLGVPGALSPDLLRPLAALVEAAGFQSLWINDTPHGDSLAGLTAASETTSRIALATGVIPVDRRSGEQIADAAAHLDPARLVLGIGSGGPANALERVGDAVAAIRSRSAAPILVGALGPRMRHLAATQADGVLLNWLTPAAAADAMADLRRDSDPGGGGSGPAVGVASKRGVLYVRTAVEASALPALAKEAAAYGSYPSYAANFARIGASAIETTIDGTDPAFLRQRVGEYSSVVDEVVLRAVVPEATPGRSTETLDAFARFIDAVHAA